LKKTAFVKRRQYAPKGNLKKNNTPNSAKIYSQRFYTRSIIDEPIRVSWANHKYSQETAIIQADTTNRGISSQDRMPYYLTNGGNKI